MRKLLTTLAIMALIATPAFADSDIATMGITGGYSMKDNTALFGFNAGYSYYASINESVGIGGGVHGDFAFGLNHRNDFTFASGFIGGLGLEFRISDSASINLLAGPAIAVDMGIVEPSVGIGLGADASFSYFFGTERTVGMTAGVTLYPQFLVFDDSRDDYFSLDAYGYIAMSFRFPASLAALPAMLYFFD